jgi:hypothetical protein
MSGAQDGKSHYESPRMRQRWGEGDLGGNPKGVEITWQRRALRKDSRAKEGGAPRGNEEIAWDLAKKGRARKTMASETAGQNAEREKQIS